MRIILQKFVDCLFKWTFNKMNLGKMVEESIVIEDFDRSKKVLINPRNANPPFLQMSRLAFFQTFKVP